MRKLLGVWRAGGEGGLGGSASQPPGGPGGGGGSVGAPTYVPQNDPHDALIIWNIHKWREKFFRTICPAAQAPISQGPSWSGQGSISLCLSPIFDFSTKF